ncbi:hypothetical protein GIB67_028650 [Kingdonia uniflora]|uniref:Uncharacterized protein n=1 Tax=Kingdonia uniflora TaxID=39325 RepID=A0A7J7KZT9_9MAGN|nr:hypothetical protein GIB67_028650 [Kingdonia uniflora]
MKRERTWSSSFDLEGGILTRNRSKIFLHHTRSGRARFDDPLCKKNRRNTKTKSPHDLSSPITDPLLVTIEENAFDNNVEDGDVSHSLVKDLRARRIFSPTTEEKIIEDEVIKVGVDEGERKQCGDNWVQTTPPDDVFLDRSKEGFVDFVAENPNGGKNDGCGGGEGHNKLNQVISRAKLGVLVPCSQKKIFKSPGSFSYRRLLPYLNAIVNVNSSDTLGIRPCRKLEKCVEEQPPSPPSAAQKMEISLPVEHLLRNSDAIQIQKSNNSSDVNCTNSESLKQRNTETANQNPSEVLNVCDPMITVASFSETERESQVRHNISFIKLGPIMENPKVIMNDSCSVGDNSIKHNQLNSSAKMAGRGLSHGVPVPCSKTKLFKTPSSFNYRRLLPYLNDVANIISSDTFETLPCKKMEKCVEERLPRLPSAIQQMEKYLPLELLSGDAGPIQTQQSYYSSDASRPNSESPEQHSMGTANQNPLEVQNLYDPMVTVPPFLDSERESHVQYDISRNKLEAVQENILTVKPSFSSRIDAQAKSIKESRFDDHLYFSTEDEDNCIKLAPNFSSDRQQPPETLGLHQNSSNSSPFVPGSPIEGILKRNPRGCRGLCTCLNCASFRLHAERAFEFSKTQMQDAEEVATGLMKEVSYLRNLLLKSIDGGEHNLAVQSHKILGNFFLFKEIYNGKSFTGRKAAKKPTQSERLASLEDANTLMVNKMDAMMAVIFTLSTKNPSVEKEQSEGVHDNVESVTRGRGRDLPMGVFMRDNRNAGINPTSPTPLRVVGRRKETIFPQNRPEISDSDNEQRGTRQSNTFASLEIDVESVDKFADFRDNEVFVEIEENRVRDRHQTPTSNDVTTGAAQGISMILRRLEGRPADQIILDHEGIGHNRQNRGEGEANFPRVHDTLFTNMQGTGAGTGAGTDAIGHGTLLSGTEGTSVGYLRQAHVGHVGTSDSAAQAHLPNLNPTLLLGRASTTHLSPNEENPSSLHLPSPYQRETAFGGEGERGPSTTSSTTAVNTLLTITPSLPIDPTMRAPLLTAAIALPITETVSMTAPTTTPIVASGNRNFPALPTTTQRTAAFNTAALRPPPTENRGDNIPQTAPLGYESNSPHTLHNTSAAVPGFVPQREFVSQNQQRQSGFGFVRTDREEHKYWGDNGEINRGFTYRYIPVHERRGRGREINTNNYVSRIHSDGFHSDSGIGGRRSQDTNQGDQIASAVITAIRTVGQDVKLNIPELDGKAGFMEWLSRVDRILTCKRYGDSKSVMLLETKLTEYALNWWDNI